MCSYLFTFFTIHVPVYCSHYRFSVWNKTKKYDSNIHALDIWSCTPDSDFYISIYNTCMIFLYIILDWWWKVTRWWEKAVVQCHGCHQPRTEYLLQVYQPDTGAGQDLLCLGHGWVPDCPRFDQIFQIQYSFLQDC